MVAPISGPFTKSEGLRFPPPYENDFLYYKGSTWYRQKPPFDIRLRYSMRVGDSKSNMQGPFIGLAADSEIMYAIDGALEQDALDKAWAKFVEEVGSQASFGATLAEMGQAIDMISARALQLLRFMRALHRLDFHSAAGYLRLNSNEAIYGAGKTMKKKWNQTHNMGDVWLEVHFGWAPLASDIYNGCNILQQPIRPKSVTAGASASSFSRTGSQPNITSFIQTKVAVRYRADVKAENENLNMLSRLGVINPVALVWEIIPFSFVVDWFVNVGAFINSYSDLAGIEIRNPSTTTFQVCSGSWTWSDAGGHSSSTTCHHLERVQALVRPGLHVRSLKLPSISRAATSISLLTQALPRSR
jgi:hypothetical protein